MKLSSLTPQDKIKLAAELDGWIKGEDGCFRRTTEPQCYEMLERKQLPKYATSYDVIIPLIQKQLIEVKNAFADQLIYNSQIEGNGLYEESPSQLLDALLVATGKAEM